MGLFSVDLQELDQFFTQLEIRGSVDIRSTSDYSTDFSLRISSSQFTVEFYQLEWFSTQSRILFSICLLASQITIEFHELVDFRLNRGFVQIIDRWTTAVDPFEWFFLQSICSRLQNSRLYIDLRTSTALGRNAVNYIKVHILTKK